MRATDISKIVITHFDCTGDLITNKKLQKILYYLEAWSLVYHTSLIDEDFEAWVHGPVIPSIYHEFRNFGYSPIKNKYAKGETSTVKMKKLLKASKLSKDQLELIMSVLHEYGGFSSFQLESLTHLESPWLNARKDVEIFAHSSTIINKKEMKTYYSSQINVKEKQA